tara:strand:+ start:52551 stop:52946 length:396 start_codon:yes stop_codon:yes gene_type:complete
VNIYKSQGIIEYKGEWAILKCSNSITKYYKWWVDRLEWKKSSTTLHGAHITIVNGNFQKLSRSSLWKKYNRKKIDFTYSSRIMKNSEGYYWLNIKCPFLEKIREELGVSSTPKWPYHLTICFIDPNSGKKV